MKIEPRLMSYLKLRKTVGVLSISFPIVLVVGSVVVSDCKEIQSSISAYYHTEMRDVYVGFICAIALFLFAYNGYDKSDSVASDLACLFGLGAAFFPTSVTGPLSYCIPEPIDSQILGNLHFVSSGLFLLMLAYFLLIQFTKSSKNPTEKKLKRNIIYRISGFTILGSILLIIIYLAVLKGRYPVLQDYDPIFWLETIALWAFGISWLIKGKAILMDD
jgi:hypothetical protein